ncbi:AimR family lysis-lysogeny pheromone receptor [Bacillus cereus]|uniref:AimR family lysis-lysogeny pheromone receptor n=1 Tax=Bacillus cereus TaxID=1396 RepID=UPI00156A83FB|nr:AimR family lysis-lysogeny pheromone receptor [Bacillus cereus]UDV85415.1 AimR family lysis-lysogeny pheromone receptor [Bacillus cereus]UDV90959.1 AimR family lysis-lysogeny pheromone receptor [Bacillus cereus]
MQQVMNELLSRMDSLGYSRRGFSEKLKVSREKLRRGLACEYEMDVNVFFNAIDLLFEQQNEKRTITREYFSECESISNIEVGLIYCQVQGEYDLMNYLINKHEKKSNLGIFFSIYKLFNKRNKNELRGKELYNELSSKRFSSNPHCQVMVNILLMLSLADMPNNNAIIQYVDGMEHNLEKMQEGIIKDYLRMLADERKAYMYLWRVQLDECRDTCYKIINSCIDIPIIQATAFCCLGESYQFESPSKSIEYISKAIEKLGEVNVPLKSQKYVAFQSTLAHVRLNYEINIKEIDLSAVHKNEKASYEYKFGNRQLGLALFKEMETEGFSPFQRFSYSKCIGDLEGIKQALLEFELSGLSFYGQLCKNILMSKGEVLQ